uniref:IBR domain-containing protein n=1 Tax=Panagrolaimus davidi TaxID=227884 RepID=A0A914Q5Y8_9BILA
MLLNAKIKFEKNDQLTEALIHKCHRCFTPFIKDLKNEGCNQMTCTCGATQCYNCREPIYSSHKCSGKKLSGQEIHERDVANAKLKQFVQRFI